MLKLKLFGTPSVDANGAPVIGRAAQGRRLALFAILAAARGRAVSRDKLIGLVWPESTTERARAQLSDDLYIIRSSLGDGAIRSSGDDLLLDADAIACDVERFERLLDEGRTAEAVETFGGPLLDGFHLPDSAEFEHWLDAERARLARRHAEALESLAEASEAVGDFAAAAGWWRKVAAEDPYNGRVTLRLMRALDAAGNRADALKHARVHAALLREEFEAEPDPEVEAFAERLRLEPATRPPPEPVVPARFSPEHVRAETTQPNETAHQPAAARQAVVTRGRRPPVWRMIAAAAALGLIAIIAFRGIPGRALRGAPPLAHSVGVLPFVNMSPDADNLYFSDGLTEQIITVLSHIEGLRVAARTSSFALRDEGLDVRAIGDTLGVAAVLEGSVRKDGNTLRVTAQLIDASTGYHIWASEYDRELRDVFAVQDEIARAIAEALELRLASGAGGGERRPEMQLEAYDLYLRGLYQRNTLNRDAMLQAIAYFDSAIAREPDFALAYAAKATVYGPLVVFNHVPAAEGVREMREATMRALALDSTLGEAHAALGIIKLFWDWEWEDAERSLRRAIALNPNDEHAYHHLANQLRATGRLDEAIAVRTRAVELDPVNPRTTILLGADFLVAGQYDSALAYYARARQLDPSHTLFLGNTGPWLPTGPGEVYLWQGRDAEAVEEYLKVATLRGASSSEVNALRHAYVASGSTGFWRRWLEMDVRQSGGNPDPLRIAKLWGRAGDPERSLEWLERAYAERNPGLVFLRVDPAFASLRSHPRVQRILRNMRLSAD